MVSHYDWLAGKPWQINNTKGVCAKCVLSACIDYTIWLKVSVLLYLNIIQSFILVTAYPFAELQGGWSQSQLTWGEGGVHSAQVASSSQGWHIETNNPSRLHSHLTSNLKSPINLRVFRLWEEAGVPRENPHWQRENMQTPHGKVLPQLDLKLRTLLMLDELTLLQIPSCSEATVLTTKPLNKL